MTIAMTPFLKTTLRLDAAVSGGAALLMAAGAEALGPFLALPVPLLFWSGVMLLPFVALLFMVARRENASRIVFFDIVLLNAAWVGASFVILVAGVVKPNMSGVIFVAAQALAVAVFTVLQVPALRQAKEAIA